MNMRKSFLISFLLLLGVLLVEQFTSLDVQLENLFFDFKTKNWLLHPSINFVLHFFLYDAIKVALILFGGFALGVLGASFKWPSLRRWRSACVILLMSMALVPLCLAGAKKYTHMYCPYQLAIYNGYRPHFKIFTPFPANYDLHYYGKGRCFPAGHASGGFALMALFFCFKRRRARLWGLGVGLSLGWAMGIYQMLRGEHFLSHTLVSMLGAWLIVLMIKSVADWLQKRFPLFFDP